MEDTEEPRGSEIGLSRDGRDGQPAYEGDPRSYSHGNRMSGPDGPALWPFAGSLVATFSTALLALGTLIYLSVLWLGYPSVSSHALDLGDELSLIRIILGVIAGAGGVVALVVAYRRQRVLEYSAHLEHGRERREDARVLNERFATATNQLGSDTAAVRLAGIYAIASLADDWSGQRQTCIDVLCAHWRMPYPAEPESGSAEQISWLQQRMVRRTIARVIADHLRIRSATSWHGHKFNFTGASIDGGDFANADFYRVNMDFTGARFVGGEASFINSRLSDCEIKFDWAEFNGGRVNFSGCDILDGCHISFIAAKIDDGQIAFGDGEYVGTKFASGTVSFSAADFGEHGTVLFDNSECLGTSIDFAVSNLLGGRLLFIDAGLSAGKIEFEGAKLEEGRVDFEGSDFTGCTVDFREAGFLGAEIDLSDTGEWLVPPIFDGWETPPSGLRFPAKNFVQDADN